MCDENKTETTEQKTCFCQNKYFKKFLVVALGSFVGVYLALSLFAACHKPPCMNHGGFGAPHSNFAQPYRHSGKHFSESNVRPDFNKEAPKPASRPRPDAQ